MIYKAQSSCTQKHSQWQFLSAVMILGVKYSHSKQSKTCDVKHLDLCTCPSYTVLVPPEQVLD